MWFWFVSFSILFLIKRIYKSTGSTCALWLCVPFSGVARNPCKNLSMKLQYGPIARNWHLGHKTSYQMQICVYIYIYVYILRTINVQIDAHIFHVLIYKQFHQSPNPTGSPRSHRPKFLMFFLGLRCSSSWLVSVENESVKLKIPYINKNVKFLVVTGILGR